MDDDSQEPGRGDIVLVSAENSPRNSWPLGRVVEVFADKKGSVRRSRVKVKGAVLERPIDQTNFAS